MTYPFATCIVDHETKNQTLCRVTQSHFGISKNMKIQFVVVLEFQRCQFLVSEADDSSKIQNCVQLLVDKMSIQIYEHKSP